MKLLGPALAAAAYAAASAYAADMPASWHPPVHRLAPAPAPKPKPRKPGPPWGQVTITEAELKELEQLETQLQIPPALRASIRKRKALAHVQAPSLHRKPAKVLQPLADLPR